MDNHVTILFDLDGTLLDTIADLRDSLNRVLTAHKLPTHSTKSVMQFVGNGLTKLIARAVPNGGSHPEFSQIETEMRADYALHCNDQTAPYVGILPLLHTLCAEGYRIGVVSNKPDAQVKSLCKRFFGDTVSAAIGQSDSVQTKPAPDSVFSAAELLHADMSRTIYIGDSEVDVQTAKNARIPCICVLWGFRSKDQLLDAGAEIFADSADSLLALLHDFTKATETYKNHIKSD